MDFKAVENKWQKFWEEHPDLYKALDVSSKPKKYVLNEFPYPSGSGLHIGHTFSFTGGDVYARYWRMKGFNVLFPMGWDAFGLPTENYAIKMKRKPQEVAGENNDKFRSQMKRLAFSYDWSREVNTADPDYYKWTQWIFIKLFEAGLAEKEEMPINWCPSCKIGLANEEVVNGKCERCGAEVERRTISQWVVKITKYADRLIEGLKETDFIEKVKQAQINWIGKSEGARIKFKIKNPPVPINIGTSSLEKGGSTSPLLQGEMPVGQRGFDLEVFTTRPDTLYGVTFMVVSPEHKLVEGLDTKEIGDYVKQARSKSDLERTELNKDKTGVFSGLYAINPANNKEIPIWISDFVLASYGTGAIMAVPAHDERDFEFAMKFNLPVIPVIKQKHEVTRSYLMGASQISDEDLINIGIKIVKKNDSDSRELEIENNRVDEYEKLILEKLDNGFWNEYIGDEIVFIFKNKEGKTERIVLSEETEEIIDRLAAEYNGENWTQKQSVWAWIAENDWYKDYIYTKNVDGGMMINSPNWNGLVPSEAMKKAIGWLGEKGIGEGTNSYHLRDWIFSRQHYWGEPIPMVKCPEHGWVPVVENQLPIVLPEVEAYEPTDDGKSPLSKMTEWVKTTCPKCGKEAERETDTMPNWAGSDWYFIRYCDPHNMSKLADFDILKKWLPVDIYIGGDEHNTLHLLYSRFIHQFLFDLGVVPTAEPYLMRMSHGVILAADGSRMSKSRPESVIEPEMVADKYGVDVVRMYLMFIGPFEGTMAWNEKTLMGVKRFLDRLEKFVSEQITNEFASGQDNGLIINKMIKGVGEDIANFGFNTAIAKLMEGLNKLKEATREETEILIKLIAPLAPYMAEELWSRVGNSTSVHEQSWPEVDEKKLIEEEVVVPVAINGKVRGQLIVKQDAIKEAKELNKIKPWMEGKEIVKEIYIPGKMINFVIR